MTDPGRTRSPSRGRGRSARRGPAIALVPAVAAVFGGSLAWAGLHDPLAAAESSSADGQTQAQDGDAADRAVAEITTRVQDAQARVEALTVTVAEQRAAALARRQAADASNAAAAEAAAAQAAAAKAAAQASAVQRAAPAPPPRVHVVTRASG